MTREIQTNDERLVEFQQKVAGLVQDAACKGIPLSGIVGALEVQKAAVISTLIDFVTNAQAEGEQK